MENTRYGNLYGDLFYDLACSSIALEEHTSIHRLGPSCIRHERIQNTLKRKKVAVIRIRETSNSPFAEKEMSNKARKSSQDESRDNLLSMWFRKTRSEATYVPSSQVMSFLVFSILGGNFIANHPLATCSLHYTHKKVNVLLGGILFIDSYQWNSVIIVKS